MADNNSNTMNQNMISPTDGAVAVSSTLVLGAITELPLSWWEQQEEDVDCSYELENEQDSSEVLVEILGMNLLAGNRGDEEGSLFGLDNGDKAKVSGDSFGDDVDDDDSFANDSFGKAESRMRSSPRLAFEKYGTRIRKPTRDDIQLFEQDSKRRRSKETSSWNRGQLVISRLGYACAPDSASLVATSSLACPGKISRHGSFNEKNMSKKKKAEEAPSNAVRATIRGGGISRYNSFQGLGSKPQQQEKVEQDNNHCYALMSMLPLTSPHSLFYAKKLSSYEDASTPSKLTAGGGPSTVASPGVVPMPHTPVAMNSAGYGRAA